MTYLLFCSKLFQFFVWLRMNQVYLHETPLKHMVFVISFLLFKLPLEIIYNTIKKVDGDMTSTLSYLIENNIKPRVDEKLVRQYEQ